MNSHRFPSHHKIWLVLLVSISFHAALFLAFRGSGGVSRSASLPGPLRLRTISVNRESPERSVPPVKETVVSPALENGTAPRSEELSSPLPETSVPAAGAESGAESIPKTDAASRIESALGRWSAELGDGQENGRRGVPGGTGNDVDFRQIAAGSDLSLPGYPEIARKWGWQGVVTLRIYISASGSVTAADIISSSGYEVLDQAALDTVQHSWTFEAIGRDVSTVKEFEFRLRETG